MDSGERSPLGAPASTSRPAGPAAPVAGAERVEILDVLRGFAVLGILLVNVPLFFSPIYLVLAGQRWFPGPLDRTAEVLVTILAQGKFYALFSFLFGLGLALQMERAAARGAPIVAFFSRRMTWLAALGLAHALLVWFGDILFIYALLGFPLLLFRARKRRTILVWTALLLAAPVAFQALVLAATELGRMFPAGAAAIDASLAERRGEAVAALEQARVAYSTGSLAEIFATRAREWRLVLLFGLLTFGAQILALFLIGLECGRRRVFEQLEAHAPWMRRALPWLVAGGAAGAALQVAGLLWVDPAAPSLLGLAAVMGAVWGAPLLSASYVCGVCLLYGRERWRRRLTRLAPVGRMALSNYLLHSLVFTTLAYSYGFGLYGRVPPSVALGLAVLVFAAQIPLSRAWLARFRFGPAEWLWRSLTYRARQPMRRSGGDPAFPRGPA